MGSARLAASAFLLALAGCGSPPASDSAGEAREEKAAVEQADAKASMPACPFREIHDLRGSITGGRLLVTGRLDFQMAGFRPQISPRQDSPGVIALDLSLAPQADAAVSDVLRYEQDGVSRSPRGEIWCGGERLETFDIVLVG